MEINDILERDIDFLKDFLTNNKETDTIDIDNSVVSIIIGTIGFIFNALAILIFSVSIIFRHSTFRCYIYTFIIVHCICIFSQTWSYLLFHIGNHNHLCKWNTFLQQTSSTCSLWIMVLLSSERAFTFIQPYKVKKLFTLKLTCTILIIIILISLLLHIDELLVIRISSFRWISFSFGICSIVRDRKYFDIKIKILLYSISFILPFLLNSIFDIYICRQICIRRKKMSNIKINKYRLEKKTKYLSLTHEITLTLLCLSIWLLLTYFPFRLYYLLVSYNFIDYAKDKSLLMLIVRYNLLVYLAFSPSLYVILSPTLRNEIKHRLRYHKVILHLNGRYRNKENDQREQDILISTTLCVTAPVKITRTVKNLTQVVLYTDSSSAQNVSEVEQINLPVLIHKTAKNTPISKLNFALIRSAKSEPLLNFRNNIIVEMCRSSSDTILKT
ncbi:unnamed protein product [Didymodactylos carnosus]|uniref:G-protein coupled receptors family 1 profile domain-containing protein n=1 Tax=Didymodactylos carnosus TaxID=1234261 RepID=A0A8S2EBJ4_9BILA|nr:unnamed protein product [Didymodactylos carnosus]CAF3975084.1 unnamed protein product [Didymodactylos carnosus]